MNNTMYMLTENSRLVQRVKVLEDELLRAFQKANSIYREAALRTDQLYHSQLEVSHLRSRTAFVEKSWNTEQKRLQILKVENQKFRIENQKLDIYLHEAKNRENALKRKLESLQRKSNSGDIQRYGQDSQPIDIFLQENRTLTSRLNTVLKENEVLKATLAAQSLRMEDIKSIKQQENDVLRQKCSELQLQLNSARSDYLTLHGRYHRDMEQKTVSSERQNRSLPNVRQAKGNEKSQRHSNDLKETSARHNQELIPENDPLLTAHKKLRKELSEERSKNRDLQKNLQQLLKEKNDLMNRLSRVASSKLEDGNPNIVDLSDETRPTKLAEIYTELYDNEWTDALEEQVSKFQKRERDAQDDLLKILLETNSLCQKLSSEYLTNLKESASLAPGRNGVALIKNGHGFEAPIHLNKTLRQVRIIMSPLILKHIQQELVPVLEENQIVLDKGTKIYTRKCLELCWEMSVKDPPVVLMPTPAEGSPVDKDRFRFYTQSGPLVDYVVWPVMLLHKDGPTLAKGVLQGKEQ